MGQKKGYDRLAHAEPWAQQPDEGAEAYAAFEVYRDMGYARSYRAAAQQVGKSHSLIDRWGKQWAWALRATSWDADQAKKSAVQQMQQRDAARKRHAGIARSVLGKALERLKGLDVETLKPADLVRWIDVAVKIERAALGMDTKEVELRFSEGGPAADVTTLTAEEASLRLRQLTAEASARLRDRGVALPMGAFTGDEGDLDLSEDEPVTTDDLGEL